MIAAGFRNANAYYRGNAYVNGLTISSFEICLGKDGCVFDCHEIVETEVGSFITNVNGPARSLSTPSPVFAELDTDLKKALGCMTGQCLSGGPGNDGDSLGIILSPSLSMHSWQNSNFPMGWWKDAQHENSIKPNIDTGHDEMAWHAWGYGQSMWVTTGREIGRYGSHGCDSPCPEATKFQIRVAKQGKE